MVMIGNEKNGDDSMSMITYSRKQMLIQTRQNRPLGFITLSIPFYVQGGWVAKEGGGGFLRSEFYAKYRRSTAPNHFIYQAEFPNNYFGLDAMNNHCKRKSGDTIRRNEENEMRGEG